MNLLIILILSIGQFLIGLAIVAWFNLRLTPRLMLPIAILVGLAVFSVVPWFLQLLYIPITSYNVFAGIGVILLLLILLDKRFYTTVKDFFKNFSIRIKLYELPFLIAIGLIIFVSVWRCFYFPPVPRDLTSGAELIAEYAIREHTMINSAFSVDLSTTNNQYKPPFITCLQIIYKYAGFPFGQIWLSTIFLCFVLFLYEVITRTLHRLLSGILMIIFLAVPEMYSYTFMALFDYPNAVYFTLGAFFLYEYLEKKETRYLWFAGLMMGIATYIRSETIVLISFFVPMLFFHQWKQGGVKKIMKAIVNCVALLLPAVLFYLLSITIYIGQYLPTGYDIGGQINQNLGDLSPFVHRFRDINTRLLTGANSITMYGTLLIVFAIFFLLETILYKCKFTRQGYFWLYAILVVYLGYPILGYLLPLLDLDNSTKRGLFKLFPFLLLYLANNQVLLKITRRELFLLHLFGRSIHK